MLHYAHWSQFPKARWHWKNFTPAEIACRGTGQLGVDIRSMDALQKLRDLLGRPLIITSAYRSAEHNTRVGGTRNSYHMKAMAFDIRMDNHNPSEFEDAAIRCGFRGIGYYPRSGFIHIDTRPGEVVRWGDRFPLSNSNLPSEPPRRPETLAEDREVKVVAGGAAVAAAAELVTSERGLTLMERITTLSPAVLILFAVLAFLWWRHQTQRPL